MSHYAVFSARHSAPRTHARAIDLLPRALRNNARAANTRTACSRWQNFARKSAALARWSMFIRRVSPLAWRQQSRRKAPGDSLVRAFSGVAWRGTSCSQAYRQNMMRAAACAACKSLSDQLHLWPTRRRDIHDESLHLVLAS
jgi:hypothetical protein